MIPKAVRDELGIKDTLKLTVSIGKNHKAIKIEPVNNILSQAGSVKPLKNLTVLKTEERSKTQN